MKLSIPKPHLLKTLQTVEHAVNDRSTLPILSNILVETTDHELILTATDLDVGIQCRFPLAAEVERGAVAVPARRLTTIVRELPDEAVILEAKKNHAVSVHCGVSAFRLPGLPPEDFPSLPQPEETQGCSLTQGALKGMINLTAYAMSVEESRFVLNGTLLSVQKGIATLVATDGRRLAVATAPVAESGKGALEAILPAKTMRELGRLLEGDVEAVRIAPLKDNQLTFRFGGVTIVTRLIEGQFPQYEKVIPPPAKHQVTCAREPLFTAIRRASLMTTATSQAVVFELSAERLVVSKESTELGSARDEVAARYSGEPLRIAFNPEFWLDALKVLETDEVTIELSGPDRPAVIRQPAFTYLVLPMKTA